MNILNMEHISKTYGDKVIFNDISCGIQAGDRLGIIGINGTGKTTLLRILAGLEKPDEGQVVRQNGLKMEYLSQSQAHGKTGVLSYVMEGQGQGGWSLEGEAKTMLHTLGIPDYEAEMEQLSGGQKKRAALAKVLLEPCDVLILDEPTNHLDEEMVSWLEDYLKRYKGTVIMVTHDRYFLDKVTNKILEISRGKLYTYEGNYSKFLEMKAQREEMELASERKRQSILRMELEWARRGCRARTTKQKARLLRLEALKNGAAVVQDGTVEIDSVQTRMGKKTIEISHVSKGFGNRQIIEDFNYIFLKNQRIGIIGPNGCGKSTLLKLIAGRIEPDAGKIEAGETIKLGYFAQEVPKMDESRRVIDYVKDIGEYIQTKDGRITASQMLERFLFTPELQYAPIGKLSGGEKRRLYLLSILQAGPNFLVMDEVSNEIDIPTLTILEDYLNSFSGIVVMVSHDRYFLDNVADRILAFDAMGRIKQYEGGYSDYLEAKKKLEGQEEDFSKGKKTVREKKGEGRNWKQNQPVKLKFSYKEQREYETIEDDIAALEEAVEGLEKEILANATNFARLNELTGKKEEAEAQLGEKMERWVYLNDLAEKIEAQNL